MKSQIKKNQFGEKFGSCVIDFFQYCIAHSVMIVPFGVIVDTYLSAAVQLKSDKNIT